MSSQLNGNGVQTPSMSSEVSEELTKLNSLRIDLEKESAEIRAKIEPLENALFAVNMRINQTWDRIGEIKTEYKKFGPEDFINYTPGRESQALSKATREFAHELGFHVHGYYPTTMQTSFAFQFFRKPLPDYKGTQWEIDQVEKMVESVRFLAPYLKPHSDGLFHFAVFEYTLSKYCSYRVRIKPDLSEAHLYAGDDCKRTGTLRTILGLVSKYHYYE